MLVMFVRLLSDALGLCQNDLQKYNKLCNMHLFCCCEFSFLRYVLFGKFMNMLVVSCFVVY